MTLGWADAHLTARSSQGRVLQSEKVEVLEIADLEQVQLQFEFVCRTG
jgi:hypothetical protein